MADRAQQINPLGVLAAAVGGLLLALSVGTLSVVALRAGHVTSLGPADWVAIRFTVSQALVSATLSICLAVPVARALARREFFGKRVLVALLGAPFILPVMVAVLGLLAVYGRAGVLSTLLAPLGFGPLNIYGFRGVVLAHVFFNLPLVARLLLQGWAAIPAEHFRLAAQIGMSSRDISRTLERPMLRAVLPGAFATVFLLCIASFAVALALGGGPRATTVELLIYQAFRFDFDLSKAALLALVQFALCLSAATMAWKIGKSEDFGAGLGRLPERWDAISRRSKVMDTVFIVLVTGFLLAPLVMIVWRGGWFVLDLPRDVYAAALRSIVVAVGSAFLTLGAALVLGSAVVRQEARARRLAAGTEALGYLSIAASPMVIGTGLFLVIFPFIDPARAALPLTALVNAAMSLPFALRILLPSMREVRRGYGGLADMLGLRGVSYFRLAFWPRIRVSAGFATGLAAALSMGDLGVVALFADPDHATLPLSLYRLMSAYRMDEASGAALLLVALSFGLYWIFDWGGRLHANA